MEESNSGDLSALHAAFSEYASKRWGAEEWAQFGRETGTTEILSEHPRLYRSLRFNDEDYPDAVWDIVPDVLSEAAEIPGVAGQVELLAEVAPGLGEWLRGPDVSHRTKRRWLGLAARLGDRLPEALRQADSRVVAKSSGIAVDTTADVRGHVTAPEPTAPVAIADPSPAVPQLEEPIYVTEQAERRIFVVHGRDIPAVREIQIAVHEMTGIVPESLADKPGQGDTIIEKFERVANAASFAIVLLTPDDEGRLKGTGTLQPRARQNVVLELGYFFGKLGRRQVAVVDAGVEHPSDVAGLSYIAYPGDNWKYQLRRELEAAGWIK